MRCFLMVVVPAARQGHCHAHIHSQSHTGRCYFFTVNLTERRGNDLLTARIDALREAFRITCAERPFAMDAVVVLPDHLHCLWHLPSGDADFPTCWRLIKSRFSRLVAPGERRSASRLANGERGIWQRRYWEHLIRDEDDFRRHVDYIHANPLKHRLVSRVVDWPYSSFHRSVRNGDLSASWGGICPIAGDFGE